MRTDPKVEMLRRVPALAGYRDRQLAELARLVDELSLATGHVLTTEGRPGAEAFLIVEGEALVTVGGRAVARLGPGQFVGEMALLDHEPCSATVTATSPMRVLVMDPAAFSRMLEDTSMARRIARTLAERLRAVEAAPTYRPAAEG